MTASTGGRLAGKTAVVVGAGQTAGATIGNGRATALRFARGGARLLLVDRDDASVKETQAMIAAAGGSADVLVADVVREGVPASIAEEAVAQLGRIDILHNNVGIGMGDSSPTRLTEEAWDRIFDVNLKAMWLVCKHVIPDHAGAGQAARSSACRRSRRSLRRALTAYKVSKAGVNALVHQLAITNAHTVSG